MDISIVVLVGVLVLSLVVVGAALMSLSELGDERKKYIRLKAQSNAFAAVIGWMIFEIGRNIYVYSQGGSYEGLNPFIVLIVISAFYSVSLLIIKRNHGG